MKQALVLISFPIAIAAIYMPNQSLQLLMVCLACFTMTSSLLFHQKHAPPRLTFGFKRIAPSGQNYEWWDGKHWLTYQPFLDEITKRAWMQEEMLPYVYINRKIAEFSIRDDDPLTMKPITHAYF